MTTAAATPAAHASSAANTKPAAKPANKSVDKPAGKRVDGKKPAKPSNKPGTKDVNRSAEIRKVASAMKVEGTKPRPSVIVAELGEKGIRVTPTLVSIVLRGMGFRPLRKRKKTNTTGNATAKSAGAKRTARGTPLSVDDLVAVKKAVDSLGGSERAMKAIQALKRLER